MSRPTVCCLSTGFVRGKHHARGVRRYFAGGWSVQALPVNAFLVEHRAGLCLFDTVQPASAAGSDYFPRLHPFIRLSRFERQPADEVASQLQRLGIEPSALRWVVLSHLHTDHVGGVASFAEADLLVSRAEWERAKGLRGRLRGYLPQHWPAKANVRFVEFEGGPLGPFAATSDLAGDGRLMVVPTPGHTPGHIALLVRDGRASYLLGGDLAPSAAKLARVDPAVAEFCRRENVVYLAAHDEHAVELAAQAAASSS